MQSSAVGTPSQSRSVGSEHPQKKSLFVGGAVSVGCAVSMGAFVSGEALGSEVGCGGGASAGSVAVVGIAPIEEPESLSGASSTEATGVQARKKRVNMASSTVFLIHLIK